jgi:nicotinamide-nucleotide amidase
MPAAGGDDARGATIAAMAGSRRAAFVAVGSELLRTERTDTNSFLAARLLRARGWHLAEKRCVEDDIDAIAAAVRDLAGRAGLIVLSGGLGPTADDVTREGVARALGVGILRYPPLEAALVKRYAALGRSAPEFSLRMADILEGAEILPNPRGTAPGQLISFDGVEVVMLPGVPSEFETIFTTHLLHRWPERAAFVRVLHLAGVYESAVEERVLPLYDRFGRDNVTILASRGKVDLVLDAEGEGARGRLEDMDAAFTAAAGEEFYGRDGETLAGVVLDAVRRRGWRLATAESCTAGMVAARLTDVPGASDVFVGGAVAYSNELKEKLLGVPAALLAEHGAVSRPVAEAMARGALGLGADSSVAVTGVAGPGGGTEAKPVGTVHVAVTTPVRSRSARYRFPGDRAAVREFTTTFALDLLRRTLQEGP